MDGEEEEEADDPETSLEWAEDAAAVREMAARGTSVGGMRTRPSGSGASPAASLVFGLLGR